MWRIERRVLTVRQADGRVMTSSHLVAVTGHQLFHFLCVLVTRCLATDRVLEFGLHRLGFDDNGRLDDELKFLQIKMPT